MLYCCTAVLLYLCCTRTVPGTICVCAVLCCTALYCAVLCCTVLYDRPMLYWLSYAVLTYRRLYPNMTLRHFALSELQRGMVPWGTGPVLLTEAREMRSVQSVSCGASLSFSLSLATPTPRPLQLRRQIKVLPWLGEEAVARRLVHRRLKHLLPNEFGLSETCAYTCTRREREGSSKRIPRMPAKLPCVCEGAKITPKILTINENKTCTFMCRRTCTTHDMCTHMSVLEMFFAHSQRLYCAVLVGCAVCAVRLLYAAVLCCTLLYCAVLAARACGQASSLLYCCTAVLCCTLLYCCTARALFTVRL